MGGVTPSRESDTGFTDSAVAGTAAGGEAGAGAGGRLGTATVVAFFAGGRGLEADGGRTNLISNLGSGGSTLAEAASCPGTGAATGSAIAVGTVATGGRLGLTGGGVDVAPAGTGSAVGVGAVCATGGGGTRRTGSAWSCSTSTTTPSRKTTRSRA